MSEKAKNTLKAWFYGSLIFCITLIFSGGIFFQQSRDTAAKLETHLVESNKVLEEFNHLKTKQAVSDERFMRIMEALEKIDKKLDKKRDK